MIIRSQKIDQLTRTFFIEKFDAAFLRDVPGFADLTKDVRKEEKEGKKGERKEGENGVLERKNINCRIHPKA